jgi:hypothetical protein
MFEGLTDTAREELALREKKREGILAARKLEKKTGESNTKVQPTVELKTHTN